MTTEKGELRVMNRNAFPTPIACLAVILALALALMSGPARVAAQNESDPEAYIAVVITDGDDAVSWPDPDDCSSDYNLYLVVTP